MCTALWYDLRSYLRSLLENKHGKDNHGLQGCLRSTQIHCFDSRNYKQLIFVDLCPTICLKAIPAFYLRNRWWKTLLAWKILSRSSLAQWFVSKFWLTKLMLILPWQYLSVSPRGAVADWWVCADESEPACLWWADKRRMTLQTKQTMRDTHISAYSTILSPVVEEESGKWRQRKEKGNRRKIRA